MAYQFSKSQAWFLRARACMPGGVSSPVRAFTAVGGTPPYIQKAQGAYLYDEDGQKYIDYVGSWGPMIHGHGAPCVLQAIVKAAASGVSFGAPCRQEVALAEKIIECMPSIEKVRFVNSGTEATMTAVRLARACTNRDFIIKFAGCYHGHSDGLLVHAGSGALTLGVPSSPGIPTGCSAHTLVATFNDLASVRACFSAYPDQIAAVIVEPVAGNMNMLLPREDFLPGLRALCDQQGSLLIFDEVMTGFRVALGGAQSIYQVTPDLTALGKIIGGGMPVGALGGADRWMAQLAPDGPVYQAGTLSGNPVAMAAGLANITACQEEGFYQRLSERTVALVQGMQAAAKRAGVPFLAQSLGGMFGFYFTELALVDCYAQVMACDPQKFAHFFQNMLRQGVYLAPSSFEAGFMSAAHSEEDLQATWAACDQSFLGLV